MVKNAMHIAIVLCPTFFNVFFAVMPLAVMHHFLIYAISFWFNPLWPMHSVMLTVTYLIISHGNTGF